MCIFKKKLPEKNNITLNQAGKSGHSLVLLEEEKTQRFSHTHNWSRQQICCLFFFHMQMYSQVSSVPGGVDHNSLSSYIEVSDRPPLTVIAYSRWWKSHGSWVGQSPLQRLISSTALGLYLLIYLSCSAPWPSPVNNEEVQPSLDICPPPLFFCF